MQSDEFEEVLRFWFPDLSTADHAQMVQQFQWWFRAGADAAICEHLPTCSWEKTFFFMPLGHSEDFSHVEPAVRLAEELIVLSTRALLTGAVAVSLANLSKCCSA